MQTEKMILNEKRNVTLVRMIQDVGGEFGKIEKRPAVLILPGGGYAMCSDREAEVIAYPYLTAGFHAFVLRYSVAEHRVWPNPLDDYEQAMELIRSKDEEWHILTDKIAVIGFSAGGHLAGCAATISKNRPNAAILGYAALRQELTDAIQPGYGAPAPADHVDSSTCPCFLFAASDDAVVPIQNTLDFQGKLAENGIRFESHIYSFGGHGFGTGVPSIADAHAVCGRVSSWAKDSIGWLWEIFGELTPQGMKEPRCSARLNGNREKFLNVDCTLVYLEEKGDARPILAEALVAIDTMIEQSFGGSDGARYIIKGMRLRELLGAIGYTKTAITQIDLALKKILNA